MRLRSGGVASDNRHFIHVMLAEQKRNVYKILTQCWPYDADARTAVNQTLVQRQEMVICRWLNIIGLATIIL